MSEISTSFCFICLLHLANEEGLSIETARFDGQEDLDVGCLGEATDVEVEHETYKSKKSKKMGEEERKDRVVGELQALRVYKVNQSPINQS
jgi:condensin complex subunit 2